MQASSDLIDIKDEPLATLAEPLPLPPYIFDATLSEDENFLTWCSILARHSNSKKGHMGTIFVRPPTSGDPASSSSADCQPPAAERILQYANNVPLLHASSASQVPEIHAEALAISRSARRGISIEGCTVYISFPPCNECAKLLMAAGVRRCVFKKAILPHVAAGESVLAAAEANGLVLVGAMDEVVQGTGTGMEDEMWQRVRAKERSDEDARELRVRNFWSSVGETAERTRARVARWWDEAYWPRYKTALETIKGRWGQNYGEAHERRKMLDKEAKRVNKQQARALLKEQRKQQGQQNGAGSSVSGGGDQVDEDAMEAAENGDGLSRKRPSTEVDGGSPTHKISKVDAKAM